MEGINLPGIQSLFMIVAGIIAMGIAIMLMAKSGKGNVREAANVGGVMVIAAIIFVAGAAGTVFAIARGVLNSAT